MEVFDEQDSPFKYCTLPPIFGQYRVIEGAWVLPLLGEFLQLLLRMQLPLLFPSPVSFSARFQPPLRGQVTLVTLPPVAHQWFPHPLSSLSGCRPFPQKVAIMSCPVVDPSSWHHPMLLFPHKVL